MSTTAVLSGAGLGERDWLELEEFARACDVQAAFVSQFRGVFPSHPWVPGSHSPTHAPSTQRNGVRLV